MPNWLKRKDDLPSGQNSGIGSKYCSAVVGVRGKAGKAVRQKHGLMLTYDGKGNHRIARGLVTAIMAWRSMVFRQPVRLSFILTIISTALSASGAIIIRLRLRSSRYLPA